MPNGNNPFGSPFDASPRFLAPQPKVQQSQPTINPLQALQLAKQFGAGGTAAGGGEAAAGSQLGNVAGVDLAGGYSATSAAPSVVGAAPGATAAGAGEAASGLAAAGPAGWIAAAALAQSVADREGISTWGAGLKGQAGANVGEHFLDQWGVDNNNPLRDAAGVAGFGEGGGVLNPAFLSKKIFGDVS